VNACREEEAEFWDTHDFSEFEDELTPVKVRFSKRLSQGLAVRFDEETLEALRNEARRKGIGPTTLIRMRVIERLREEVGQTTAESKADPPPPRG
jgi:predicted DNA binding CopG/RHH family protein